LTCIIGDIDEKLLVALSGVGAHRQCTAHVFEAVGGFVFNRAGGLGFASGVARPES
jgi:hypothetical protein